MTRASIRFRHRGRTVELDDVGPTDTVLDYLRLTVGLTGTKEGCAEGDCGACTVALGKLGTDGEVVYHPVNSCILMLAQLDGHELVTVEDLAGDDGVLHPVQEAMVRVHGSQCGFCTPGIVMSLFALHHQQGSPTRRRIEDQLAGNLCRCTGYRPIVAAAEESCDGAARDSFARSSRERARALEELADDADLYIGDGDGFLAAPASTETLAELIEWHPDARLIAGATDVGLWVTKQFRVIPKAIFLHRVAGLDHVEEADDHILIGAGATYAQAEDALAGIDPDLGELLRRIGSMQVRASGTVGGNIANGSPIGDMPPALIALDSTLRLESRTGGREIALEDFFLEYGQQDLRAGEFVRAVRVPRPAASQHFRAYKISKRFDQDISALMGAFLIELQDRQVTAARVAFGGMAATPKRARATEAGLAGLSLDEPVAWPAVAESIAEDFTPIDDMRASADYRLQAAKGLVIKALTELAMGHTSGTRVVGRREGGGHERAA